MCKKIIFDILRDQRQTDNGSEEVHPIKSIKKERSQEEIRQRCETKNIVLNFRSIFKKILQDEIEQCPHDTNKINKIIKLILSMKKNTNIAMIRTLLEDNWFKTELIEIKKIHQHGVLQKLILQSNMLLQNKFYCLKYLNCLLNGFENPDSLIKWVPFKSYKLDKPKRRYRKKTKPISNLSSGSLNEFSPETTDSIFLDDEDDVQKKYDYFDDSYQHLLQYNFLPQQKMDNDINLDLFKTNISHRTH